MIVQCEACQTRFRLADEKVKPGGTKVRCSKCKEIFVVTPPEPEPEPEVEVTPAAEPADEPAEEAVDFGSFNMEKVTEDDGGPAAGDDAEQTGDSAEPQQGDELDFSGLESELAESDSSGEELAEDFSFADTSQVAEAEKTDQGASDLALGDAFAEGATATADQDETPDFGAAFEETEATGDSLELEFNEDFDPEAEPESQPGQDTELSFDPVDDNQQAAAETAEEFSFGDDEESDNDFSFGREQEQPSTEEFTEQDAPGEFSFDDEGDAAWEDESAGADDTFDFDEPQFDKDDSSTDAATADNDGGLQFGEIDFAGDDGAPDSPGLETDNDFGDATIEKHEEEPEPFAHREQEDRPSRSYDEDDETPLSAPPPPKKSSLSRVLVLLVLLLLILGGAAGYLYMQEGAINLNTVTRYLPFLQEYIGEPVSNAPGDRIGIKISGSSYVTGQAGQMLVIQGAAVNNFPTSRSAIAVKGILLDASGKTLLQQTVFCGNKLDDGTLKNEPFAAIEEAMNNPFGHATSNMNVAAGASIPFTIVFRNLPAGIANINVEVVDSKPGAG